MFIPFDQKTQTFDSAALQTVAAYFKTLRKQRGPMTKTEAEQLRRDLDHLCAAITDGIGQYTWGPGVVLERFRTKAWRDGRSKATRPVALAFERGSNAAWALWGYRTQNAHYEIEMTHEQCVRMANDTRAIAFTILELLISDGE